MYYVRTMASETTTETTKTTAGVSDRDFADAVQNPSSFSVDGLQQSNRSLSDEHIREIARRGGVPHGLRAV